jgi:hypothetical protein
MQIAGLTRHSKKFSLMSNHARLMMTMGGPLRNQIKRVAAHVSFTLSRNDGARRLRIPIIGAVGLENMRRREPGLERMLQSWLPDYPAPSSISAPISARPCSSSRVMT